jgi:3-oxoadipate enol-lactonase
MRSALLLIHAFPMDARMWRPQVDALGPDVEVLAPDLPGFGGAPDAGPLMTMGAAAATCLKAVDAAEVDRLTVCGLSLGGYVAFELWRMARQRVHALILANTRSGADTPDAAASRRALAARLETEGNGFLVAEPPPLLRPEAPEALWAEVRGTIADQPATSIAAAAIGMSQRRDSTPDLSAIDVPTLVITSDADRLIPPEVTVEIAEHVPGAELVSIPDAGHLSNLEAPAPFTEAIAAFLQRLDR